MNIQEQRKAIYKAETAIEEILDDFRIASGFNADKIELQNIMDDDLNEAPALKVNIIVSRIIK